MAVGEERSLLQIESLNSEITELDAARNERIIARTNGQPVPALSPQLSSALSSFSAELEGKVAPSKKNARFVRQVVAYSACRGPLVAQSRLGVNYQYTANDERAMNNTELKQLSQAISTLPCQLPPLPATLPCIQPTCSTPSSISAWRTISMSMSAIRAR